MAKSVCCDSKVHKLTCGEKEGGGGAQLWCMGVDGHSHCTA